MYETSSGGAAGGVVSGGEEGVAEVGVEAEDEEQITPSESTVCKFNPFHSTNLQAECTKTSI